MSALHLVPDPAHADVAVKMPKPRDREAPRYDILYCNRSELNVTVTNPYFGTVLVTLDAYRMFRNIGAKSHLFKQDEKREAVNMELATAVGVAVRAGKDKNGNWLYIDEEEKLLFVVSFNPPLLLAVYDKSKNKEERP